MLGLKYKNQDRIFDEKEERGRRRHHGIEEKLQERRKESCSELAGL